MSYKAMLLSAILASIFFTSYGQISDEQKIQQLQEAWLQKAQELSELGAKIYTKHELIDNIVWNGNMFWEKLLSDMDEKEKVKFEQEFNTSLEKFRQSLAQYYYKANVKGVLSKEFVNKSGKYSPIDRKKFGLIRVMLEQAIINKLVASYEKCLQELAEIDQELVKLQGESSLLF